MWKLHELVGQAGSLRPIVNRLLGALDSSQAGRLTIGLQVANLPHKLSRIPSTSGSEPTLAGEIGDRSAAFGEHHHDDIVEGLIKGGSCDRWCGSCESRDQEIVFVVGFWLLCSHDINKYGSHKAPFLEHSSNPIGRQFRRTT
jgi:hypothetical protein